MLPRPSRLKSLESELSPVFTTPPPVEPNTVLVLISVPEMMLSSNLVAVRRRAAMSPATSARMPSPPAPIAQVGVLLTRSSKNDGSRLAGAPAAFGGVVLPASAALPGAASGALTAVLASGALGSGAWASRALTSGAFASGALVSGAFACGAGAGAAGAGGVTVAGAGGVTTGATAAGAAALGAGAVGAMATCGPFAGSPAFALEPSACFCRSAIA